MLYEVITHWHGDCLGGLAYLQTKGVKSYANQMTIDIARKEKLPVPDYGFTDSLTVRITSYNVCYTKLLRIDLKTFFNSVK